MPPIIALKNITKQFKDEHGRLPVLEHINLALEAGEFFVVLGPSGSGKSTLLRIMSGLEKAHEGEVTLGSGVRAEDMSFVFQQFALLPWLTVAENVELGLLSRERRPEARRRRVDEELHRFGLEKFHSYYQRELSGGMRQRVGIARALATDPKIIFMDEPFSELDSFTAEELRGDLLRIWQEQKPTIVMVTHLIAEALELADRIAVLTSRPAHIERVILNTLPRPRQKRSAEFYKLEDELYRLIKS